MSDHDEREIPMDYVTKTDLKESTDDIKKHLDLVIKPIEKEQTEVRTILTGPSRRNGLVGDQKTMQTKIIVIYGLLLFVGFGLAKILIWGV